MNAPGADVRKVVKSGRRLRRLMASRGDTRMNDQSVGSIADAIWRFRSITFERSSSR